MLRRGVRSFSLPGYRRTLCAGKDGGVTKAATPTPPPTPRNVAKAPPKRAAEDTKKKWLSDAGTYPTLVIIAGAVGLMAYSLVHQTQNPDFHLNKTERSTINYLENEKDGQQAAQYGWGSKGKQ